MATNQRAAWIGGRVVPYWIYENWQAGPHKAVIHEAGCSFCNDGLGRSNGTADTRYGRWRGPYASRTLAWDAARRMPAEDRRECSRCADR